MSKFSGIKFPFYGKTAIPISIRYSINSIKALNESGQYVFIDHKDIPYSDYLARLSHIDEDKRITFEYTATTLQELIHSPIKWGVDITGKIFNLDKKEKFNTKTVKIDRVKDNLFWVRQISYPFVIKNKLEEVLNRHMYVTLVYIDNTWYLFKFGYKYLAKRDIML